MLHSLVYVCDIFMNNLTGTNLVFYLLDYLFTITKSL